MRKKSELDPKERKGQEYFYMGRVTPLNLSKENLSFTVEGSDTYLLKLTKIDNKSIMVCNCPAQVMDCAHIRAVKFWVTYAIDNGKEAALRIGTDTRSEDNSSLSPDN